MDYPVLPMLPDLWPAVREIYREGIATGNATFETELPDWEKWDSSHRKNCRLIAVEPIDDEALIPLERLKVLGWAALSSVSSRRVYAGVAEVSVYVAEAARTWCGESALAGIGRGVRAEWNLDPAGRHFPGESCQYRLAQVLRISRGWDPTSRWQTPRHLERCGAAGAAK